MHFERSVGKRQGKYKCPAEYERREANGILDDLVSFPASWLLMRKVLCWVWFFRISILANVGVGILLLVEVTKGMVDFSMLAFVCADWGDVSVLCDTYQ